MTGWEGRTARKGHLLKLLAKFSLQLCFSACKISPKLLHFSEAQLRHKLPLSPAPIEGRKEFGFVLKGEVGTVIYLGRGFKGKERGRGGKRDDGFINSAVSRNNHANP